MIRMILGIFACTLFLVLAVPVMAAEPERSAESIAAEIEEDRDFIKLIKSSARMAGAIHQHLSAMDEESLEAHLDFVSDFPAVQARYDATAFIASYGIEPAVLARQEKLITRLIDRYQLQAVSRGLVMDGFELAASRSEAAQGALARAIEYEIEPLDHEPKEVDRDCLKKCKTLYLAAAGSALAGYLSTVAGCSLTGPGMPFCIGAATVGYAASLAIAQHNLDNCVAVCNGEQVREDYCESDSDCPKDEFCWTGFVGVGSNECRPEKKLDKTCSRHNQCKSGCCKLHFWTNPISKVCRPADKC